MHYVYIVRCVDGSLYVGHAQNVEQRVNTHNAGRGAAFTATRRPVTLAYIEPHQTKTAAVYRERQIKRWTRNKKEALIRGDFDSLRRLSKTRSKLRRAACRCWWRSG